MAETKQERFDHPSAGDDAPTEPDVAFAPEESEPAERVFVGTGLFWGLIFGVVLTLGVVILAAQNTSRIDISFLGWDFSTPLIVVVLGALLIGVVLDELFGLVYRLRRRKALSDRDQLRRIQRLDGESDGSR